MRKCYKQLLLVLLATACNFPATSQDVGFSQFYDQPLLRNPALAGVFTGDIRLTAAYRNQWQSVTVPYRTYALNAEIKTALEVIPNDNLTIGFQLIRDVAGTSEFSTLQILPAINYSLPLSEEKSSYLSLGFMGGLMQQRFDPSKLILGDQFVAGSNGSFSVLPASSQVFNNTSVNYPDFSAGISYNSVFREEIDYFIGAGIFHLTRPKVGFYEGHAITLNRKLTFNAGVSAPTSETDQFILYGDYFKQFGERFAPVGVSTLQIGMMYSHDFFVLGDVQKTFTIGALYRWNDAVIPVVRLQLDKFTIGASYDVNVSKLVAASTYRGGFEIVLSFRDVLNSRNAEMRQVLCPRFRF